MRKVQPSEVDETAFEHLKVTRGTQKKDDGKRTSAIDDERGESRSTRPQESPRSSRNPSRKRKSRVGH